jgi:acyl-CoA synthetase (NDP forming)
MSNAGFESVAIADNLRGMELATLTPDTRARLERIFRKARIGSIVAPSNPLDVTPVLGDEAFADSASAVLADPNVELGLIGCVPLTGALQTLPASEVHTENLDFEGSVSGRLIELWRSTDKPWVTVVDAGPAYDPFAQRLARAGIPTFRSVDRALAALGRWAKFQLR